MSVYAETTGNVLVVPAEVPVLFLYDFWLLLAVWVGLFLGWNFC